MKEKIYRVLPHLFQELMIALYNIKAYRGRYRGRYQEHRKKFRENRSLSVKELKKIQRDVFYNFLKKAINTSSFYKNYELVGLEKICELPIIKKEDIRLQINNIYTINKSDGIVKNNVKHLI